MAPYGCGTWEVDTVSRSCRATQSRSLTARGVPLAPTTRQWIAREHPASARRVAWSPDGTLLVSAGDDGIVSIWNASDGRLFKQLRGHQGKVNDVAWSRDGKWVASGGGNRDSGELF